MAFLKGSQKDGFNYSSELVDLVLEFALPVNKNLLEYRLLKNCLSLKKVRRCLSQSRTSTSQRVKAIAIDDQPCLNL